MAFSTCSPVCSPSVLLFSILFSTSHCRHGLFIRRHMMTLLARASILNFTARTLFPFNYFTFFANIIVHFQSPSFMQMELYISITFTSDMVSRMTLPEFRYLMDSRCVHELQRRNECAMNRAKAEGAQRKFINKFWYRSVAYTHTRARVKSIGLTVHYTSVFLVSLHCLTFTYPLYSIVILYGICVYVFILFICERARPMLSCPKTTKFSAT